MRSQGAIETGKHRYQQIPRALQIRCSIGAIVQGGHSRRFIHVVQVRPARQAKGRRLARIPAFRVPIPAREARLTWSAVQPIHGSRPPMTKRESSAKPMRTAMRSCNGNCFRPSGEPPTCAASPPPPEAGRNYRSKGAGLIPGSYFRPRCLRQNRWLPGKQRVRPGSTEFQHGKGFVPKRFCRYPDPEFPSRPRLLHLAELRGLAWFRRALPAL